MKKYDMQLTEESLMTKEDLYFILMNDDVITSIQNQLPILLTGIPELNDLIGFEHRHPHHHLDVWNHTLLSLHYSKKEFETRCVLLLHDIGKPHSYQEAEVRHFKGHAKASSKMAHKILNRLHFEEEEIKKLCYLIEQHDTPITEEMIKNNNAFAKQLFQIQYCDSLAHHPEKLEKRIAYLLMINEKINTKEEQEQYQKQLSYLKNKEEDGGKNVLPKTNSLFIR